MLMLLHMHNAEENGKSKFPHTNKSSAMIDLYNVQTGEMLRTGALWGPRNSWK